MVNDMEKEKKNIKKKEKVVEEVVETKKVKEEKKETNAVVAFLKELIPYVVILVVVVSFRTYIATPIIVHGSSMNPTLDGGELMVLNKRGKVDRFDIVVVDTGAEEIIKRVIAMPGETIACENGKIYVNGRLQEESYSQGVTRDFDKVTLSDDEYFVMGDNRENSKDSRAYGPFKEDKIKGTTKLVLFPFNKIGNVE